MIINKESLLIEDIAPAKVELAKSCFLYYAFRTIYDLIIINYL